VVWPTVVPGAAAISPPPPVIIILSSRSQPFSRHAAAAASHICVTASTTSRNRSSRSIESIEFWADRVDRWIVEKSIESSRSTGAIDSIDLETFNLSLSIKITIQKRIYFNLSRVNLYCTLALTPTSTYWDCSQTTNTYHDVSLRHTARVFKALSLISVNFSVYRLWNLGLSMIPHNIGVNPGGWGS
jgi:hypothetical protein